MQVAEIRIQSLEFLQRIHWRESPDSGYGSVDAGKNEERMVRTMNMNAKIEELLTVLKKKEDEKQKNTVLWVLAIIGTVAAVTGIAFAVYRFFAPDYLEDFEDEEE